MNFLVSWIILVSAFHAGSSVVCFFSILAIVFLAASVWHSLSEGHFTESFLFLQTKICWGGLYEFRIVAKDMIFGHFVRSLFSQFKYILVVFTIKSLYSSS